MTPLLLRPVSLCLVVLAACSLCLLLLRATRRLQPFGRALVMTLVLAGGTLGVRLLEVRRGEGFYGYGSEVELAAASLAHGRGLSDAYGPGTGPTAHVSPVYP